MVLDNFQSHSSMFVFLNSHSTNEIFLYMSFLWHLGIGDVACNFPAPAFLPPLVIHPLALQSREQSQGRGRGKKAGSGILSYQFYPIQDNSGDLPGQDLDL